jgi:hypothetical protein
VRPLAVGAAAQNKVYDGTTGATISLSVSNRVAGDAVTPLYTSALFGSAATGTGKTVTVNGISLTGADAANYSSNTSTSTTASITQRQLTVTASATDKVYDGATAATVALSDNRLSGDAFSVAHTAAVFNSKNVGAGKQVTVSGISISGTDAANYTLASTSASTNASISARPITITAVASNKTYDGTPTASVTLSDNRVSGDVLTRSFSSATFANENVGTGKPVTVAGLSLSGTDAANYSLTSTSAGTTADITPRALLVTAHGVDRTYDGSAIAGITLTDNRVAGDALTASYGSATFVTKNVGTNKSVSVTGIAISGTDAANYTVNSTATTAANVTQRALTATASAQTKRYDGTTAATVTMGDNRVSGDVLTVAHDAAEFDSAAVGNNRVVTVSGIHLIGTDAANYTVNQTAQTTASIIAANGILVTFTAASKVYDGSTATVVMGTPDLNGVQAGDDVSLTGGTVTFDTKDTGINKTVTWNGFALTGADAANYELPETFATTTANITPAALTVTADDKDMVWGQAAPAFTSAYAGFIAGETPADLTGTLAHTVKNGGGTVVTVNQTTPAGTYRIVPSGQTSTNYSITYVDGDLNVGFIAGSGTYRPDGKVSLSKASGYSGNGVYNTTGAGQTKSVKVARGKSRTFYIQVQNDGDDLDTFTLKNVGTPKGGVSIQYFDGATRVTRQLMLGTYRIVGAGAGTTRSLRVVMTVGSRARVGATSLCGVRVTSAARPELTDTVKTAVTATR